MSFSKIYIKMKLFKYLSVLFKVCMKNFLDYYLKIMSEITYVIQAINGN